MPFAAWQRGLCSDWFKSNIFFLVKIVQQSLVMPAHIPDTLTVRAIAIFLHYGVAKAVTTCSTCNGKVKLETRMNRGWTTYGWTCATVGHKHMEESVNAHGILTLVPVNSWMPFLDVINSLRLGRTYSEILSELSDAYGSMSPNTVRRWRRLYQQALGSSLGPLDALMIGGKGQVVVVDETVVGVNSEDGWSEQNRGINKSGAMQTRSGPRATKKLVRKH
eukprot:13425140-Heterocapsa_arctica.AAC.1